ncbi:MAG: CdaR family protein [Caldisericota bacterium]|nr:CdaR family protein [Caldisericota bacterium]
MKKFFLKIFNIKVISIILAILIWYYVAGVQGPTVVRTFKVPVVAINMEPGVVIKNKTDYVNVTAGGPSRLILGLKEQDFTALIDLSGKTLGEYYVDVDAKSPLMGVTIEKVSPEKARVSLEKLTTIIMPIAAKFSGEAEEGFLPGTPIITPDKASITGPESVLASIKEVFIQIDLTGIKEETNLTLPVKIFGKDGENIVDVQVSPISCMVKVSQSSVTVAKIVPIVPNLNGTVFKGFGIKSISVEPAVISISGDFLSLSDVSYITTDVLNIDAITKSTEFELLLIVPEGVNIIGAENCKIKIDVRPLMEKKFTLPVIVKTDDDLVGKANPEKIEVIVSGFEEDIDAIDVLPITAVVDATGITDGTYQLPVVVEGIPGTVVISIVQPESVSVTIESANNE